MADRNRGRRTAWRLAKSIQARQERITPFLSSHLPGQATMMTSTTANGAVCPLVRSCRTPSWSRNGRGEQEPPTTDMAGALGPVKGLLVENGDGRSCRTVCSSRTGVNERGQGCLLFNRSSQAAEANRPPLRHDNSPSRPPPLATPPSAVWPSCRTARRSQNGHSRQGLGYDRATVRLAPDGQYLWASVCDRQGPRRVYARAEAASLPQSAEH